MATVVFKDSYAYDLSRNITTKGEIFDDDVINQSIETILSTSMGERLFLPEFGSLLPNTLFESLTLEFANNVLDSIISAIKEWEDRVSVTDDDVEMVVITDQNAIVLTIPYRLNGTNITSTFKRKIIF